MASFENILGKEAARSLREKAGLPKPTETPEGSCARLFRLVRSQDLSGVSGTGTVAEGVVFSDGTVAMRWLSHTPTTTMFDTIDMVKQIHGHQGSTRVVFDDEE
jgi:hypothetical protein